MANLDPVYWIGGISGIVTIYGFVSNRLAKTNGSFNTPAMRKIGNTCLMFGVIVLIGWVIYYAVTQRDSSEQSTNPPVVVVIPPLDPGNNIEEVIPVKPPSPQPPPKTDTPPVPPKVVEKPSKPSDEDLRLQEVDGLQKAVNGMVSTDARTSVIETVPRIKGGIHGGELSKLLSRMVSTDRSETIKAVAPNLIYPLTSDETDAILSGVVTSSRPECIKALNDAKEKKMRKKFLGIF